MSEWKLPWSYTAPCDSSSTEIRQYAGTSMYRLVRNMRPRSRKLHLQNVRGIQRLSWDTMLSFYYHFWAFVNNLRRGSITNGYHCLTKTRKISVGRRQKLNPDTEPKTASLLDLSDLLLGGLEKASRQQPHPRVASWSKL